MYVLVYVLNINVF
uniref:Uncharacterized protein n=1 Tax=Anguilla anguilla TaxID=7936 RepID=A0A0E9XU63_ANGAN